MPKTSEITYVINTVTSWNEPPRARHQLAQELAKNRPVIFIARNEIGRPRIDISQASNLLRIIVPYYPVDYRLRWRVPLINEIYQNWLYRTLASEYGENAVRVINFDNTATQLFKYFKNVVYYCNDEWLLKINLKSKFVFHYWKFVEKQVARKSLFCIGVSDHLTEKLKKFNDKSYFIPTATSVSDFPLLREPVTNHDSSVSKSIVYVGFMRSELNADWIRKLALELPKHQIIMVGPYEKQCVAGLMELPNVLFPGAKTGQELYEIIEKASVCIAPYMINENLEKCVSIPNKFWLYLSFGKPIVTSSIPNLLLGPEYVYQSSTAKEFIANIKIALSEKDPNLTKCRIELASQNTWENRVSQLLALFDQYCQ
jgi:glycosyltransferase involved in cell wall biosynthesis